MSITEAKPRKNGHGWFVSCENGHGWIVVGSPEYLQRVMNGLTDRNCTLRDGGLDENTGED